MHTFDGKPIHLEDASLEGWRRTRDGYLVADVRAARTGIYLYRGDECGKPEKAVVRVYRPESVVFDKKTLSSFTNLDVTNDHPPEMIDSKNWKKYSAGYTGEDIVRDGQYVRVPMIVKDEATIQEIQDGKRGLSFGYTCDLDFTPGKTEDGQEYDAVQKSLCGNHLAIVSRGRAGAECKIGDRDNEELKMADNIRKILVDGFGFVTVTDESERALADLSGKLKASVADNLKLVTDHGNEVKTLNDKIASLEADLKKKDADLGTKDAEITTLKAAQSDQTKLDSMLNERFDLVSKAKKLGVTDEDCKGKANNDIIRLAVQKKLGEASVKDKSDDYVRASFDFLSTSAGNIDPVAQHFRTSDHIQISDSTGERAREDAHKAMLDHMTNAWRNPDPNPKVQ